jgi:hypothetical protein
MFAKQHNLVIGQCRSMFKELGFVTADMWQEPKIESKLHDFFKDPESFIGHVRDFTKLSPESKKIIDILIKEHNTFYD